MNTRGFSLVREERLSEVSGTVKLWRHDATGAELLSIVNNDENKCLGATFRTPPKDSTGVAHILEHSVLCGSEKYPVKEPFVELLKGSLQTFLNAFTFPDKTCYPVASANLQDFYNLVDVYLDAVFFPRIDENCFQQEGWHIEADSPAGPPPITRISQDIAGYLLPHQSRHQSGHLRRRGVVIDLVSHPLGGDDPCRTELLQMLGDARLGHACAPLHAGDIAAPAQQQAVHDLQPDGIGECFQQRRLRRIVCPVFHGVHRPFVNLDIRLS